MAAVRPFRAFRYNPVLIRDPSRVIAPPYDVISPEEQERLHDASPHNIVRLTLGKLRADDTDQENRHSRARREFQAWVERRILVQDPEPALYLIQHAFSDGETTRSRLGFLALLELREEPGRWVHRHEATLAAPKADRAKLLEAVSANLEPIFCVYPDDQGLTQAQLSAAAESRAPTVQMSLGSETVRLWVLTDPRLLDDVGQALSAVAVLIADGHHRFEVACSHRARHDVVMSYFVSMADPGLLVRPIHRLVPSEGGGTLESLRRVCLLERCRDLPSLTAWLQELNGHGRFGYYDGRSFYRVVIRPERLAAWLMAPPVPLPMATLDVSILHGLILPALGGSTGGFVAHAEGSASGRTAPEIAYTAESAEAIHAVDCGTARSAWLLRAIPLSQVYAVSAQGLTCPPKSTYFYPKVPSGLALHVFSPLG